MVEGPCEIHIPSSRQRHELGGLEGPTVRRILLEGLKKLEQELWNLKMVGSDLVAYMARFSDLSALCPRMVNPEPKKVERYI